MAKEDPDLLARRIGEWIACSMRLKRGSESLKVMAELGLTVPQISAMHVLQFEGPMSVTDLTARLDLSTSATSHLVQRLVEQGIVSREEDPDDRRQKRVSLSATGKKLVEKLMKARHREMRASLELLSAEAREMLLRALDRMLQELGGAPPEET